MIEELLLYSLAGLIVYITASMFEYRREVKTLREINKMYEMYIEERNNKDIHIHSDRFVGVAKQNE